MAKKYLSLEEAAKQLGISTEALNRYRDDGDIRGFADRGTWKFRADDVEKLGRSLSTDSSPEVPLLSDEDDDADSVFAEEDSLGEQATVIRNSDIHGQSDSDVRLVGPEGESADEDSGFDIPLLTDSDSDVRLVNDETDKDDSDSDVQLVQDSDSDSDVQLLPDPNSMGDSDSDIRLIEDTELGAQSGEDQDEPGSDITLEVDEGESIFDEDSSESLDPEKTVASGSGILLESPADSGISLEDEDSGISLEVADSGISLESADSGMALEAVDSGISLDTDDDFSLNADSGIDVLSPAADSGISLDTSAGSSGDDMYQTIPMLDSADDESGDDKTQVEVPALESEDDFESDFEIAALDDEEGDESSVLMFDEDEEEDDAQTVVQTADADDTFDLDDEYDDDLEVADEDLLGEDDELDVFDADDEDFDEGFAAGESHAEFMAPTQFAPAVEQDWGVPTFVGLLLSTVVMSLCGLVILDLVQAMWAWNEPASYTSSLLNMIRGMF